MRTLYITGPTAVGKSSIAVEVALRCNGEIVGADAFQVYEGLDVITAKPSAADLAKAPHHMIGCVPVMEKFDVAQYAAAATKCIAEIHARGKLPIVVGGTGLYVRALTHGLSDLPQADTSLRAELDGESLDDLQARYTALDPEGAKKIDLKNKRRLVRAIEVCLLTGKPFSSFRAEWETAPEGVTGFFLTRDRDDLHARTDQRVEEMFAQGAVEEVRALPPGLTTAAQAIGVKEILQYLAGTINETECKEQIKQATRQYAKRQITWFKRDAIFETVNLTSADPSQIAKRITDAVSG